MRATMAAPWTRPGAAPGHGVALGVHRAGHSPFSHLRAAMGSIKRDPRPPRLVAHNKAAAAGTAPVEEPTVAADEGGNGACDSVGDSGGVEGVAAVAGATMAAAASVDGACKRAAPAVIQAELSSKFEAGDRTGAGENKDIGRQRRREHRRARQRTLARARQTQAVSTGIVRGSGAVSERRERTFVLDEGLEVALGRRKNSRRPRLEARDPAGGCARVVAGHSGPICVLCCCGQCTESALSG